MRMLTLGLGAAVIAGSIMAAAVAPATAAGFNVISTLSSVQSKAGSQSTLVHCRRWRHCHWWGCHRCG